jgi:hypothetical protein
MAQIAKKITHCISGADSGVGRRGRGPPFKRKQYINKLYLHTVLKVFSQDEVFRPTLSLIPGSAPVSAP